MDTRVPYDRGYTALLGAAVYLFASYEWNVIYLIQQFRPEFVNRYCRGAPMASGQVGLALQKVLEDPGVIYKNVSKAEVEACHAEFVRLLKKRNALIHAHPMTQDDGAQILNYQARLHRPWPDLKWTVVEVETAIREFDAAACSTNDLLRRLP